MPNSVDTITKEPAREDLAVIRESLRLRCTQAMHALVPMSGALSVVGALLWSACPRMRLLAWLLTCFAATIVAAIDCRFIIKNINSTSREGLARLNMRFFATTVLNTAAMGSGVWWVATVSSTEIAFFVTLCVCFYAIGHVINGSSHLGSFLAGLLTNLGQAIAFWLTHGDHGIGIATMLAGIVYLLLTFARQNARGFSENVRMRFANLDLVAALSDEKKAVEQALAAAKEANLAKSRFLAAASHDLRQPLHALSLWTGLLRESLTSPTALERMDKINSSVESLNKLFSGLLDLSRLDAASINPERRSIRLQGILEVLSNEARGKAQAKGIDLQVVETAALVRSDPLWLERILRNLLDNAIKYTPRGSVAILCEDSADSVRVAIRDTGIGIAPADQPHVFEEYFQVHNPARDRALGVGLGLAIVKRACDLLGHPITLRSEPGLGSEFSVVLPKCDIDSAASLHDGRNTDRNIETFGRELEGFVVVVIEDDHDVAQAMDALLREWRCIPVSCSCAEEGIALLISQGLTPQAIIADWRLANDVSGSDAIATLRRQYGPVSAALVTGEVNVADLQAKNQSSCLVLQKPLDPSNIRNLLRSFRLAR